MYNSVSGGNSLEVNNVEVVYNNGHTALSNVTFNLDKGVIAALVGINGSGKTSFRRIIFGELIPVYGGEVRWFGNKERSPLSEVRKKISYVSAEYQSGYDRPALGWEVVASCLFSSIGLHEEVTPQQKKTAFKSMNYLGIEYLGNTLYKQMSYGEARRVLLARALVRRTRLMILDEPCAGLDVPTRETFLESLEKLVRKRTQLIYVTHRIEEIMPCFTHILYLKNGKVFKQGRKEVMMNSQLLSKALDCSVKVEENYNRFYASICQ